MKDKTIHEMLGIKAPLILPSIVGSMVEQNNTDIDLPEDFFEEDTIDDDFDKQIEQDTEDFQENLAENIDAHQLSNIAAELCSYVDSDIDARQPWMDMIGKVKDQMGIGDDSSYEEPFPGASSVVYPIITTAQIQFQARALPEIFPNDPAKGVVIGESNPMLLDKADRVADVINYQVQYLDKGNRKDFRKMLWWIPLVGSGFRRVYHDALKDINMVRFVEVDNFIVPYGVSTLEDAPRFTHRFYDSKNDMMKLMRMGFYLNCTLNSETFIADEEDNNSAQSIRDDSDGKNDVSILENSAALQECYDIYTDYDLPGYEDMGDDGDPTGIALPYIFTIHVDSQKVVAIRRNWKQFDDLKQKRIYFSHYKYQEGPGFYGSGLPHLIGSLQEATTGALRAFGDAMSFSIMQGGWKLQDAKIAGSQTMSPGQFQDVDCTFDDINKAIKIANFPVPSPVVIEYIKMLDQKAQAIVSIQDIMTGDSSPQNSPVGSTLAMIEQASKIITAQHKSLYESFSEELGILADLNYDFLPDNDNFAMPGKVGVIQRSDFDGSIDIQLTADPSVASFQQRIATNQATLQLAQMPELTSFFNMHALGRRILDSMNVPSIDEIYATDEQVQQQQQQAQQNPPPPPPEVIKANAAMQVAQAKSQEIQTNTQIAQAQLQVDSQKNQLDAQQSVQQMKMDMMQMQSDAKINMSQLQLDAQRLTLETKKAMTSLQLEEKQMDMKNASDNKMIDARFLGSVAPPLMQASDNLATEQDSKVLADDGVRSQHASLTQEQKMLHDKVMDTAHHHMDNMNQPVVSPKQNILIKLMNKIRGK